MPDPEKSEATPQPARQPQKTGPARAGPTAPPARPAGTGGSTQATPVLIPHFILEQYAQGQLQGHFAAVSLFVDISGFSAVTNTLMQHGNEAAEEMAELMLAIFDPLVHHVYAHGGLITGFAGDAFTALFIKDRFGSEIAAYQQALAAAVRIRQHMAAHPSQSSSYGLFPFAIKLGLADGEVEWGILTLASSADPSRQAKATYFFGGSAVDDAAAAEHRAAAGELILSPAAQRLLRPFVHSEPVPKQAGDYVRVTAVRTPLPPPQPIYRDSPHMAYMADFVPDAVHQAICRPSRRGEFRQVLTLFIQMKDISSREQLAAFMQALFGLQQHYGGYINKLDFGDKGCNVLLFWGAPTSFENDVERALDLVLQLTHTAPVDFRAGLTYRPMYAGLAGSPTRGEFACYGLGINLAARLMIAAPWGEVWLDEEVARRAEPHFALELQGHMPFKGFAEEQPVYRLCGRRETEEEFFRGQMVGRRAELDQLTAFIRPLFEQRFAGILVVQGEAGIGKSRLVHAHKTTEASSRVLWALCQTDQILRQPLNPFRYWLQRYFGQLATQSGDDNQHTFDQKLDQLIETTPDSELGQELQRVRSFLGALVGLHWDQSLYALLDPQGRFENTLIALKALIKAESLRQPVVIQLEDAHWLDQDSIQFIQQLVHNVEDYPFAIIATARPRPAAPQAPSQPAMASSLFGEQVPYQLIELSGFTPGDLEQLAHGILGAPATPPLIKLLDQRAEGNPFFAEHILLHLREAYAIELREGAWHLARIRQPEPLPTNVRAVLIARLDRLAQDVKEVVQTASVLGQEFEKHILTQMLREDPAVSAKVAAAEEAAIWALIEQARYLFKHALLRDTAYEMQLRARRRQLHQLAAETLERLYTSRTAQTGKSRVLHYGEIAYHYETAVQHGQTDLQEKARTYLQKAGTLAAESYENIAAADYFSRALLLAPSKNLPTRYDLLLAREKVYDLQGNREAQAEDLTTLTALVDTLQDPCKQAEVTLRQANYAERVSDYPQAIASARAAIASAQAAIASAQPDRGGAQPQYAHALIAAAHVLWGRMLLQQGDYAQSQTHLEQALPVLRQAGMHKQVAHALRALGVVYSHQGRLEEERDFYQQSQLIFQELGDRLGQAQTLNNLGTVSGELGERVQARDYFQQALAIFREIGARLWEAMILYNLGVLSEGMGEYLQSDGYHRQTLTICREIGNRYGEAMSLNNLGILSRHMGDYTQARNYIQQALDIWDETGDQREKGETLDNLGTVWYLQGDYAQARRYYQQALDTWTEIGNQYGVGLALHNLGAVAHDQGDQAQAQTYFQQALALRQELGMPHFVAEDRAGLARVALAQDDLTRAQAQLAQIMPYIESNPLMDRAKHPFRLFLTCYQVLQRCGDPRAAEMLSHAYGLLQERAAKIPHPEQRRSFLCNVPPHHQIVELYIARNSAGHAHPCAESP